MKRYLFGAAAMLLAAVLLFGCGTGNVSDDPGGRITDPTVIPPTVIPAPTVPEKIPDPTRHPASEPFDPPQGPIQGGSVPSLPREAVPGPGAVDTLPGSR